MWSERPNALKDGLVLASSISLVMLAILIVKSVSGGNPLFGFQCQEVVVDVVKRGNILAECPAGTHIEIDEFTNVICRCEDRRSFLLDREPSLMFNDPMPTKPTTPAPFRKHDDTGIEL